MEIENGSGIIEKRAGEDMKHNRCKWAQQVPEIYERYHDEEWGKPQHEDAHLFEMLILEGFQAGLSWLTILKKREAFRKAFENFDVKKIAAYTQDTIEELMSNADIVRNRRKIEASILNAQAFIEIQKEYGSFDVYLWGYTNHQVVYDNEDPIPVSSPLSDEISKDLKKRGMKFVGTTIIYAYLQAVGVVNAHDSGCFLYKCKEE